MSERSGFEPELGGILRDDPERNGFEPELGGVLRQKGVYSHSQSDCNSFKPWRQTSDFSALAVVFNNSEV
ncbi:MAG TPA: hypothetical protein V6C58_22095 [Allocoleopsis sp.]